MLRREIAAAEANGDHELAERLRKEYEYYGIETCAVDGMCQTRCPVNINTGERFQISGHNKIQLHPRPELCANSSTVRSPLHNGDANDNTPETALEAAEQTADEAPATPAKTETQVAVTPSNEVDFDPIVEEKKAERTILPKKPPLNALSP